MTTHIQLSNLSQKELVLALIKADMRSVKFISGLEQAGALVEYFHTDLSVIILKIMGFEETDRTDSLYDFYDECMYALIDLPVYDFHDRLPELAVAFYNELLLLSPGGK